METSAIKSFKAINKLSRIATPAKVRIVVIHDPVKTKADVAVHALSCRSVAADVGRGYNVATQYYVETTSLTPEQWEQDYNADFVAESGPEGAHSIKFHFCARRVMAK